MIDSLAMLLCIAGFGLISLRYDRTGFIVSAAGSVCWLLYGIAAGSVPLVLQSIAFLVFSTIGAVRCLAKQC